MRGCHGFQCSAKVEIPGEYNHGVEISLSLADHLVLLTHSLVLPLIGFSLGGIVANALQMSEPLVVAGSLTGLLVGIALCKAQSHDRLMLIEVIKK